MKIFFNDRTIKRKKKISKWSLILLLDKSNQDRNRMHRYHFRCFHRHHRDLMAKGKSCLTRDTCSIELFRFVQLNKTKVFICVVLIWKRKLIRFSTNSTLKKSRRKSRRRTSSMRRTTKNDRLPLQNNDRRWSSVMKKKIFQRSSFRKLFSFFFFSFRHSKRNRKRHFLFVLVLFPRTNVHETFRSLDN